MHIFKVWWELDIKTISNFQQPERAFPSINKKFKTFFFLKKYYSINLKQMIGCMYEGDNQTDRQAASAHRGKEGGREMPTFHLRAIFLLTKP